MSTLRGLLLGLLVALLVASALSGVRAASPTDTDATFRWDATQRAFVLTHAPANWPNVPTSRPILGTLTDLGAGNYRVTITFSIIGPPPTLPPTPPPYQ